MRNLKRALSLALACVMLLGMMATGAGAAGTSFTDFDQIVNQEAAKVTSGLGIFDGYTDGSFGPENVVTRAEMAVIICKLLNGSDVDPGNFTGISKFNDVPSWAEGYVNYCASMGIVVGVGEGKFNPSATVSTVEAATMLLKALGYFVDEDKLSADWKTVVTGRATTLHLYGDLTLGVDEGLTRDNVAELVFHTLFAQRVAYDDNRHLYVKNTNRDMVVTNGTEDYENTFAENTFGMWVVDGIVTANSYTDDSLSETTNNAPRTNVVFDAAAAQDYPAAIYQGSNVTEYPFEYTTDLDMICHAARVYYKMERNAPVVFAIVDQAEKTAFISYDSNTTRLADAANEAGFRRNTINQIHRDSYLVNYDWDVTVGSLSATASEVDLDGPEVNKTLLVISNSTDYTVDYVIVLDQYLDTVRRVVSKDGVNSYDLTTADADKQNIAHGEFSEGSYVVVTDIGNQGDMFNLTQPEIVSANITKITGVSNKIRTVKSIIADGTEYAGSPVADHKNNRLTDDPDSQDRLDNTTNFEAITTLGDASLILDFQGKCIGLAEPESVNNYAYAAQFGIRHTGTGLNTEYSLTVKLYFQDGTNGVYLVNTDANEGSNTFYGLKFQAGDNGKQTAGILNGGVAAGGSAVGTYTPWDVYTDGLGVIPGYNNGFGSNLKLADNPGESTAGLGVYKATLRSDDTVVLEALAENAVPEPLAAGDAFDDSRLIAAHSTIVLADKSNLRYPFTNAGDIVYQTTKTAYFYVSGSYAAGDLSVGTMTGVANAKTFTHDNDLGGTAGQDTDDNDENDSFRQILLGGVNRSSNNVSRKTVAAVMVWGIDLGTDSNLYFYKEGSYHLITRDGAASRATENDRAIVYDLYNASGELVSKTYDNDGKYYEASTASSMVKEHYTGWYKLGSKNIEPVYALNSSDESNKILLNPKTVNNPDGTVDTIKWPDSRIKNVYILNATTYHDEFVDNIFTYKDEVGGIILDNAKVIDTVDCGLDSVKDIARACTAGHEVKISYTYATTGNSAYQVKTIFITEYNPDAGHRWTDGSGQNLVVRYDNGFLYIFVRNGYNPAPAVIAAAVQSELERVGFQDVTATVSPNVNGTAYTWTVTGTLNNVKHIYTEGSNFVRKVAEITVNSGAPKYLIPNKATLTAEQIGLTKGKSYEVRVGYGYGAGAAALFDTYFVSVDSNGLMTVLNHDGTAHAIASSQSLAWDVPTGSDANGNPTYQTRTLINSGDVAVFMETEADRIPTVAGRVISDLPDAGYGALETEGYMENGKAPSQAVSGDIVVLDVYRKGSRAIGSEDPDIASFTPGGRYVADVNGRDVFGLALDADCVRFKVALDLSRDELRGQDLIMEISNIRPVTVSSGSGTVAQEADGSLKLTVARPDAADGDAFTLTLGNGEQITGAAQDGEVVFDIPAEKVESNLDETGDLDVASITAGEARPDVVSTFSVNPVGTLKAGAALAEDLGFASSTGLDAAASSAKWVGLAGGKIPEGAASLTLEVKLKATEGKTLDADALKAVTVTGGTADASNAAAAVDGEGVLTLKYSFAVESQGPATTVKAKDNGTSIALYAYYGSEATIDLNKQLDAVKAAVEETQKTNGWTVVEWTRSDPEDETSAIIGGKWSFGTTFNLVTGTTAGSLTNPNKLYPITINGGSTMYVYAGEALKDESLKGKTFVDGAKAVVADASSTDKFAFDASGNATVPTIGTPAEPINYVQAMQLNNANAGGDLTTLNIWASKGDVVNATVATPTSDWVALGSKLTIEATSATLTNKTVEVTVGNQNVNVTFDASGKASYEVADVQPGTSETKIEFTYPTAGYTVILNGDTQNPLEPVANTQNVYEIPASAMNGATKLAYFSSSSKFTELDAAAGLALQPGGAYRWTVSNFATYVSPTPRIIELNAVYTLKTTHTAADVHDDATKIGELYTGMDENGDLTGKVTLTSGGTSTQLVPVNSTLYLKALAPNTILAVKDSEADNVRLTEIPTSVEDEKIWKVEFIGDQVGQEFNFHNKFEIRAQLPQVTDSSLTADSNTTCTITDLTKTTTDTTPAEVKLTSDGTNEANKAAATDTVSVRWVGATGDGTEITRSSDSATFKISSAAVTGGKVEIKLTSTLATASTGGAAEVGTLEVTLKDAGGKILLITRVLIKEGS